MPDLIRMMREEGVMERGHLQMNKGTLSLMTDRHLELLADKDHPEYAAAYYRALPFIVELRAHGGGDKADKPELETCLEALYGVMLLRMQGKPVSEGTERAIKQISEMLRQL